MVSNKRLYSLILNVTDFLNGKDDNPFKNRYLPMIPELKLKQLNNIQTFLNNNYFTVRQLLLHIYYNSLFDPRYNSKLHTYDYKHIDEISKLFTKKRFDKDDELLKGFVEKGTLKNYFDSVIINSSGEMIALELMKAKYISPIFVIRFKDRIVLKSEPSDETVRMLRIIEAIERVLKTDLI